MLLFLTLLAIFLLGSVAWWWWLVIKPLYRFRKEQEGALIGPALTLACVVIGVVLNGEWAVLAIIGPWTTLLAIPELMNAVFVESDLLAIPLLSASLILLVIYFAFRNFRAARSFAIMPAAAIAVLALPVGIDWQVGELMRDQVESQGGACLARKNVVSSIRLASNPVRFSYHAVTLIDGQMHAWSYKERLFFIVDPSAEAYGAELIERCK